MLILWYKKSEKESRIQNLPSEVPRCLEPDHHADFTALLARHLLQQTTAHNRGQKTTFGHSLLHTYWRTHQWTSIPGLRANDQELLCALNKLIFSHSPGINNIQTVSNFYGVDSDMLSSEKSIFENYDCWDAYQRKNTALMVKIMHQNGLHDILSVLYKVASNLILCWKHFQRPSPHQNIFKIHNRTRPTIAPLLTLKESMQTWQYRMTCRIIIYIIHFL